MKETLRSDSEAMSRRTGRLLALLLAALPYVIGAICLGVAIAFVVRVVF